MSDFVGTGVQATVQENGANLRTMTSDYFPPPADEPEEKPGFTVRVSKEQKEDLKLVADTWNAMDKALGIRRKRRWKPGSVVTAFAEAGLDRFWAKAAGARPDSEKDRKEFIARAVKLALAKKHEGTE